ncbi:hypothetical protein HZ326_5666 [Fusarium oxysporum f. sp. albedinis]|nr:hypothetical protein HZ326_5666 [Fusarium oxysporum f. sp. albedinis]
MDGSKIEIRKGEKSVIDCWGRNLPSPRLNEKERRGEGGLVFVLVYMCQHVSSYGGEDLHLPPLTLSVFSSSFILQLLCSFSSSSKVSRLLD